MFDCLELNALVANLRATDHITIFLLRPLPGSELNIAIMFHLLLPSNILVVYILFQ